MDMVPGMVTYFWLTPTRTGRYDVLCEQLCGLAHFAMRGRVVVDEEGAFQTWLATKPTYAETAARVAGGVTESCGLIWSMCAAVLTGIASICDSAVAAFRRANR